MDGDRCQQKGCPGFIDDGYCGVCGHADVRARQSTKPTAVAAVAPAAVASSRRSSSVVTGTGSAPVSRATHGSRRTSHSSSRSSRKQLGAGLITLPDLPSADPEKAILTDPSVPERKRFCPKCEAPLKREMGFCGKCGQRYSFVPSLKPGDMVAGQYEVRGALAYGGLGWIYLGFDRVLSRYVVLKGLLNAHDEVSAAAAVAERQFLAAVKHPNVVGIYNFVQHGTEGLIVMEYIGGKTLKQIRQERGPLPVAESIAYIHRILPAFSYLHQMGLVYCDFKPDNMMLEKDDVKLIDMGGVRRIDDLQGDIYGTVGYSAPEASTGPSVASDLFTVGRTLAVLLTDIGAFSGEHRFTLPNAEENALFARQESLYRLLLKATAENPDDRFESADEMGDQLLGVLREVVSVDTGTPRPGRSVHFSGDGLGLESGRELEPVEPSQAHLPSPAIDAGDPGLQLMTDAMAQPDGERRMAALRAAGLKAPRSREIRLRLAAALADSGKFEEADGLLQGIEKEDAWDWRVLWLRGRMRLASKKPKEAQSCFDQVYFDLPGELAPKLALGLAAETAGNLEVAVAMYDLVSRTDPEYVSASFGLARCLLKKGDRKGAVAALDRVPPSSSMFLRSRVEAARTLIRQDSAAPCAADLARASAVAEALSIDGFGRFRLSSQILETALLLMTSRQLKADSTVRIFGQPLEERVLRTGLERSLRSMAQLAAGEARIDLVDRANRVRPRTLF